MLFCLIFLNRKNINVTYSFSMLETEADLEVRQTTA